MRARHLPYGTVLDPVLSPSGDVVSYTRCGDSAIWTGHWLAAASFRFAATRAPEALAEVRLAIDGLKRLVDVTGTGLLSRCAFPADSPYANDLASEEARHGIYPSGSWTWVGNTSRDQYAGAFFGLAAAYDLVNDLSIRTDAQQLVTRMLDYLTSHNWVVAMPDGKISTLFLGRPDQQLSFLAVGRRVNSTQFRSPYQRMRLLGALEVPAPVGIDVLDDHDSYFKFNLDTITLYNLVRLEDSGYYKFWYEEAYKVLRRTTDDHGNAHFNMIDRALRGPDANRDAGTRAMLDEWLERPRTDEYVDWRGTFPSCGSPDRACAPLPQRDRVRTDFLWQRSPFLLYGGGAGNIEGAGIDYLLPYWMARYYGVVVN